MESKANEAHLILSNVPGVSNSQSGNLFANRHASHPQIPASLPSNFVTSEEPFNNGTLRPAVPCKRKLSSSPSNKTDRTVDVFTNGGSSPSSTPAKRICQKIPCSESRAIAPAPSTVTVNSSPGFLSTNSVQASGGNAVSSGHPPQRSEGLVDPSKSSCGKLEQVIDHVLALARSSDPHEDVFVLPHRNRELIPLPSPLNQEVTPASSINTSPQGSPTASPRLTSPSFHNTNAPSNPMYVTTPNFPRSVSVDQVSTVLPLPQRSLSTVQSPVVSDPQRERPNMQQSLESNPFMTTNTSTAVTMLMKTGTPMESSDTSFMQPKRILQSGNVDPSATMAAVYSQGSTPRQILSKVPVAYSDSKSAVQSPENQKRQLKNTNLQPTVLAYIPQRQIYDPSNTVVSVHSAVQPKPNISNTPLAVKRDSALEITNQVSYQPHAAPVTNGVPQSVSFSKQSGMTPAPPLQFSETKPAAMRKRPQAPSKRKKAAVNNAAMSQGAKMPAPMTFVRNPLVPQNTEFAQHMQPSARSLTASQEAMNQLIFFESKKFLSDPSLEPFAFALPPFESPTSFPSSNDAWFDHCGTKYMREGYAPKASLEVSKGSKDSCDRYLYQFLPQTVTHPLVQTARHPVRVSGAPPRVCVSPEPLTLDNRMKSLWDTLRHPESPRPSVSEAKGLEREPASLLPMLRSPCVPREGPTECKTPPLPISHIPNTCLLKSAPSLRVSSVNSASATPADREAGEPTAMIQLKPESFNRVDTRIVFAVGASRFDDVTSHVRYICNQVGINQSLVRYGDREVVVINPGGTLISEEQLHQFAVQLKLCFSEVSMRPSTLPPTDSTNFEEISDTSKHLGAMAESQRERMEDPLTAPILGSKFKEDISTLSSIAALHRVAEERCRFCHSRLSAESALRQRLDELPGATAGLLTVDNGFHASDVFSFCGDACLTKFMEFLSTHLSAFHAPQGGGSASEQQAALEPRQHPQQLVFGNKPGSPPVLLTTMSHKSLKMQLMGRRGSSTSGKRKISPKQKRYRDARWRQFKPDVYHARKFANASYTAPGADEQNSKVLCMPIRNDEITDTRVCVLCGGIGDGDVSTTERLLCLGPGRWVHLNCALWCFDIYESLSGSLHNVNECIERALKTVCSHCGKLGAGLPCYNPRCSLVYHVPCAISVNCMFFTDRGMYCSNHQPRDSHPMQLTSLAVRRKVYVTRDESQEAADVVRDAASPYRIRIGNLILNKVGQLLPHQIESEHFHTQKYIYPVHFSSTRIYWSMRRPGQRCPYHCEIKEQDGRPLFQVTAVEKNLPDIVLKKFDCTEVWREIAENVYKVRSENGLNSNFPHLICGEEMFGLSEPHVVRAIESLPGVDNLVDYAYHFGRLQLIPDMPLAINPSGCARCEPSFVASLNRRRAYVNSHEKSPTKSVCPQFKSPMRQTSEISSSAYSQSVSDQWNRLSVDLTTPKNSTSMSWSQQYRRLKSDFQSNVAFGRSRIQGFGLFAAQDLEPNTIVIEYIGEVIRLELANKREKEYEARNRGIYMFRLEDNMVIDATMCGGLARYINHSCQPNCFTKYVKFDNEGHIVIITKRKIEKGEELTYDYQFDLEDRTNKIPCLCGAMGCRKWMN